MGKTALKAGEIRDTYKQSEVFCLLAVTSAPPTSTPPPPQGTRSCSWVSKSKVVFLLFHKSRWVTLSPLHSSFLSI